MLSPIERARRYLRRIEGAVSGQRGHDRTYHAACVLVNGFALSITDALIVIRDWNETCQPRWSESELLHKLRSAARVRHAMPRGYLLGSSGPYASSGSTPMPPPAPKAAFSPKALERIASKTKGIADMVQFLAERSAVDVRRETSLSFLRRLYPPGAGERVIVFNDMQSQGQLVCRADANEHLRHEHLPAGPDGVWFLPQPVTGEFHPNPRLDGKLSRRSEEAITAWRYVVLESDKADPDLWLRALVQMPLRIVSICESGGRSVHALARVDADSKADWDALVAPIKPTLVTLGADSGALTAVRLTRLPQARRGERVQRLLFLNPAADAAPILPLNAEGKR